MRYDYDILSDRIHQASMEAGDRWMLNNVTGKPIRMGDSRDHVLRTTYDVLQRPTQLFIKAGTEPEILTEKTVYGEGQGDARKHRGRIYQHFDSAGVATNVEFDFKGNLGRSTRLSSTTVGARTETYTHDTHGNMTSMPHLTLMQWDYKDQLSATSRQATNDNPPPDKVPETTFYVYDAGGQRTCKVTERQNGTRKSDPAGLVDGSNLYKYVRDNPIKLIDPIGTNPPDDDLNLTSGEIRRVPFALHVDEADAVKGNLAGGIAGSPSDPENKQFLDSRTNT